MGTSNKTGALESTTLASILAKELYVHIPAFSIPNVLPAKADEPAAILSRMEKYMVGQEKHFNELFGLLRNILSKLADIERAVKDGSANFWSNLGINFLSGLLLMMFGDKLWSLLKKFLGYLRGNFPRGEPGASKNLPTKPESKGERGGSESYRHKVPRQGSEKATPPPKPQSGTQGILSWGKRLLEKLRSFLSAIPKPVIPSVGLLRIIPNPGISLGTALLSLLAVLLTPGDAHDSKSYEDMKRRKSEDELRMGPDHPYDPYALDPRAYELQSHRHDQAISGAFVEAGGRNLLSRCACSLEEANNAISTFGRIFIEAFGPVYILGGDSSLGMSPLPAAGAYGPATEYNTMEVGGITVYAQSNDAAGIAVETGAELRRMTEAANKGVNQ